MPEEIKPEEKESAKIALPKEFIRKKSGWPKILVYALIILVLLVGLSFLFAYFGILKLKKQPLIETITPERQPVAVQVIDSDGDGLTDQEEINLGTNINLPDSDNDGLFDYEEVKVYKTDPLNPDTDNDGYKDGEEVKAGYDPRDPSPGAKILDFEKEKEKLR